MNIILPIVFASILVGIAIYVFSVRSRFIICLSQLLLFAAGSYQLILVRTSGPISLVVGGWTNGKGVPLYINSLAAVMILLTTFFFFLFFLYDWEKLKTQLLFVMLLFLIQGLLCALFASHDLFNIFVLMEVSTILVTLLIVFKKNPVSYYDGLIYLLTNIVGMSFFLLGIGYIYRIYGVYDLHILRELIYSTAPDRSLLLPFALMMTGVSFKVGVMPVFSWLPRAHGSYGAPSVVSGILSGLYINVGFLYFIKLQDLFAPVLDTRPLFLVIGFTTAFIAGFLALVQNDIKRMLAYSTASQIGYILMGLNLPYDEGFYGSIYHIISHGIFKVLLFLCSGILIEIYKTRDLDKIQGVFKKAPLLGISIVAGILGITGAPFFNGSIGKYLISKGAGSFVFEWLLYGLNFITILYLAKFSLILFGPNKRSPLGINQRIVIGALGIFCIIGGIHAPIWMYLLFGYDLAIQPVTYSIKSLIYLLSATAGFILYYKRVRYSRLLRAIREIDIPFNLIAFTVIVLFMILLSGAYLLYGSAPLF